MLKKILNTAGRIKGIILSILIIAAVGMFLLCSDIETVDRHNEKTRNDNSSHENTEYDENTSHSITVRVSITCHNVIGNAALKTDARLPDDGEFLDDTVSLDKGATVYDALVEVCDNAGISYVNSGMLGTVYISAINDLTEKQCGSTSGWKFKVNDVIATKSSGAYELSDGDYVEWYYAVHITD